MVSTTSRLVRPGCELQIHQLLRDHAGYASAVGEAGVCHDAHQPHVAAAINQVQTAVCQLLPAAGLPHHKLQSYLWPIRNTPQLTSWISSYSYRGFHE